MKTPAPLQSLVDEGLIDAVLRQLMSGKEANVYVVRRGDQLRAAKVYRSREQQLSPGVDNTESRKAKSSRKARAMTMGTRFGREAQEDCQQVVPGSTPAWRHRAKHQVATPLVHATLGRSGHKPAPG